VTLDPQTSKLLQFNHYDYFFLNAPINIFFKTKLKIKGWPVWGGFSSTGVANHPLIFIFLIFFFNLGWGHFGKKNLNGQISTIWKFGG
jgi:hypothetical protein